MPTSKNLLAMTNHLRIDFLVKAREALGRAAGLGRPLSQERFAALGGWSSSQQYKYEAGVTPIGDHVVQKVIALLEGAGVPSTQKAP